MRVKAANLLNLMYQKKRGKVFRIGKPGSILPTRIRGIHRLSHMEIIDDVADIEHQVAMVRNSKPYINFPLSKKIHKRCIEKGITLDDIMKATRTEGGKIKVRPSEVKMQIELTKRKAEAAKLDREIGSHQAELKALSNQLNKLREQYTRSVRDSESNRMKFGNSVLTLRDNLWRETSRTANTSQKLEELRVLNQELGVHDARTQQFLVEMESASMHIEMLKEIAAKSSGTMGMDEYPPLIESLSKRQRNQFDRIKRELKRRQQETQFISRELDQAMNKFSDLQYQIEQQNKINNELTTREKMRSKELEHIQKEVRKFEEKLKGLKEKREDQLGRIKKAQQKNESLKKVIACAEKRIKESEDGVQASINELTTLKAEIRTLQVECTEGWQETTSEKERCAAARDKAQELTRKHDNYVSRSKNTMDRVVKRKKQLAEEQARLEERLKNAEEKTAEVEKELKTVQLETEEATEKLMQQKKELLHQIAKNSETIIKECEMACEE